MTKDNLDIFSIKNNFNKTENVSSIEIIKSKLNYIPRVTIAIPTFKRHSLLKEAIDSALKQIHYDRFDIIIVDNNPQRNCETEKLLNSLDDLRISYYKNDSNIGMAGNWNRLFELAKGEYVVMLHDDDLLLPTFLNICMKILEKEKFIAALNPLKFSFSNKCTNDLILNISKNNLYKKSATKRIIDLDNHFSYAFGSTSGCVFKKSIIMKTGGFNDEFYPSIDYHFINILSSTNKVYILNQTLILYRWEDNESLKTETLNQFIIFDYIIRKAILQKYFIPSYLRDIYLSISTNVFIQNSTIINKNFEFSLDKLGLKDQSSKYSKFIFYSLNYQLRFLSFVIKKFF